MARAALGRIHRRLPFGTDSVGVYQHRREEGVQQRWRLIEPELTDEDASLLDVGCNAGEFLERAADAGLVTLGVDRFENEETRNVAVRKMQRDQHVGLMIANVTPENVTAFPTFDVVLLLSVYHHWYAEFGEQRAKSMLSSFGDSRKIFFEPPSDPDRYADPKSPEIDGSGREIPPIPDFEIDDEESVISYHLDLLESVFGDTHSVELLGSSDRMGSARYTFLASSTQ